MLAWLLIESKIHDRQDEYYKAINESYFVGESSAFLKSMLNAIKSALVKICENQLVHSF